MTQIKKKYSIIIRLFLILLFSLTILGLLYGRKDGFSQVFKQNYPHLSDALVTTKPFNQYKLPNLNNTKTMDSFSKKMVHGKNMIPQGLAIADNYLIISAYNKEKQYHSVLYLLDKKSGEKLTTLVLPDSPHLGGLAYDPVAKNLWLTTETTAGTAQLSAISLEEIQQRRFNQQEQPIKYTQQIPLTGLNKASFLTYHQNTLVVGYFTKKHEGTLISYPLTNTGLPVQTLAESPQSIRGKEKDTERMETTKKLQGVTFYKEQILFSQSYGDHSSKLLFAKNQIEQDSTDFDEDDFIKTIDFPPYMEQILVDKQYLYVLFESSGTPYRSKKNVFPIKSVLVFDLEKLVK